MSEPYVWECPNCGSTDFVKVGPNGRQCEFCGSVVARPESRPKPVTCTRCGFENQPGVRYCSECGLAIAKWTLAEKPKTDPAIISIIATIIGSFFVPVGGAILGLVLAYRARAESRASGGKSGREDLARTAIAVGWIGLALSLFPICIFPFMVGGQLGLSVCSGVTEFPLVLAGA